MMIIIINFSCDPVSIVYSKVMLRKAGGVWYDDLPNRSSHSITIALICLVHRRGVIRTEYDTFFRTRSGVGKGKGKRGWKLGEGVWGIEWFF